jgi:hypothetical protein
MTQPDLDCYMIAAKPGNLRGDHAQDSDKQYREPRQQGIEMLAQHERNRGRAQECWLADICAARQDTGWRKASLCTGIMATSLPGSPVGSAQDSPSFVQFESTAILPG